MVKHFTERILACIPCHYYTGLVAEIPDCPESLRTCPSEHAAEPRQQHQEDQTHVQHVFSLRDLLLCHHLGI